jgi:hypothetical protein
MHIQKKIVTDELMRPVAVQISYHDWLEIERRLKIENEKNTDNLSKYEGALTLTEDPVDFQGRIRGEWA